MDFVKELVIKALPEASLELISSVVSEMESHGVEDMSHLEYFNPETDTTVLKTIQKRRLKRAIEDAFSKNRSHQIEVSSAPSPTVANTSASSSFSLVENFNIPYHKFPKLIEQGKVPTPSQRLAIVRLVCDDLQTIIDKPLKKHLEVIARKIVEKYPNSFQDTVKGAILGTGYSSLLCQLINRCENTRRPHSTSTKRKLGEGGKPKKISNTDSYGCVKANYLPDVNDEFSQEEKIKELQSEYLNIKWDQQKVDKLMDETYPSQRMLIVKNVELEIISQQFPFLCVSLYFLKHAEKLLGFDVLDRLIKSIDDKAGEVIKCIKNCQVVEANKLQFVEILCEYFDEEKEQFLRIFEEDRSICEISDEICPLTPLIVALGNPFGTPSKCILLWGKSKFADFIDFPTAVAVWFSSFFVFNLEYPESLQATLEFIQRGFLDINPDKGSRAKRTPKPCNINRKVRQLCTKLAQFRWSIV